MVSIIGGGPIGNYTAALLAQKGYEPTVYEEHDVIGKPIQCTGIATIYLGDILNTLTEKVPKDFTINIINKTRVFSPNGSFVDIDLKDNYIVDRTLFDQYFARIAQEEGAKYVFGKKFQTGNYSDGKWKLQFNKGNVVTDTVLIGADGPFSSVAKAAGIYGKRTFAHGLQVKMAMKERIDPSLVEFFLGNGYFGWLVPEDDRIARVGIAAHAKSRDYFNHLLKQRPGEIIEWQSGPIPVYNPQLKTQTDSHVYLVGDAATHVKATTYGGIIPGLIASETLATSIVTAKSYEKLWKKRIGKELWTHLMIRKILDKFSDKHYDTLLRLVNQDKIISAISEHDREFPTKLVPKLLFREPRFLQFAPLLFNPLS